MDDIMAGDDPCDIPWQKKWSKASPEIFRYPWNCPIVCYLF
jgi:hypothetical protein